MSIELSQIILYSQNKERLATFLSRLMDMELSSDEDTINLGHPDFNFQIFETGKQNRNNSMVIELNLSDRAELEDLARRAEFCQYSQDSGVDLKKIKWVDERLEVVDPDGRTWRFISPTQ
jgi:uncharacterized glyoxalase superfamily protein PhnB